MRGAGIGDGDGDGDGVGSAGGPCNGGGVGVGVCAIALSGIWVAANPATPSAGINLTNDLRLVEVLTFRFLVFTIPPTESIWKFRTGSGSDRPQFKRHHGQSLRRWLRFGF